IGRHALRMLDIDDEETDSEICDPTTPDRGMALPTGAPTALGCDDARAIVAQARAALAAPPLRIDPAKFAEATSDWLDPHGLWSVAPDAPVGAALRHDSTALLSDLQAAPGSGPCTAALRIGEDLVRWSRELGKIYDE